MPTVQQILDDINIELPNSFLDSQKVIWMNECLNTIYKDMNEDFKDEHKFTTTSAGKYLLPTDCMLDQIISIKDEYITYFYYDALNRYISISPIPPEGTEITILYKKRPLPISLADLTAVPAINEDYHSLLKLYVMRKIASSGNNPDPEMVNNYTNEYNNTWYRMKKDYLKTKIKTSQKKRCNRWW